MAGGRIDIEVAPDLKDFPGKLSSGLKSSSGLASTLGKGIGVAIAAGTTIAAVGLKSVIDLGIEYQGNLNELQAVTGATGIQMAKVGSIAKELGSDMSLPATSAADAAAAMKELAKGGLSVDEAMTAAKGTLQLAAAAQIDAAEAAGIQSDALNQFGLSAENAGHVADVLANTANAASGEITDMANALKYVGPVAKALGVDIDSTATAIGVLATAGVRGEQAGTSLRGILASLADPSKEAAKAMDALGIVAFDQAGKFVGLRAITEQLSAAKGRLTDQEFQQAAAAAFGNEGLTTANILADKGTSAFDSMATAVGKAGGAAEVAAAKAKGLGGAWDGLKSQLETVGIGIFEAIDGPLEKLVRSGADKIDQFGKVVVDGLNTAVAAGEVYGPRLAAAISSRASVVGDAVKSVLAPIVSNLGGPLNEALNTSIELWEDFTGVIANAVDGAKPVANGIAAIAKAAADGDGPVSTLGTGLRLIGDVARVASVVLIPLGAVVGGIASAFAALPGPIQSAVVAMGLIAAFRGPLTALGATMTSAVVTPFRQFGETLRLQQALVTGSTGIMATGIGKVGLAMAALQARVPVIGKMADSYRFASTAAQGFVVNQSALVRTASGISGSYTGAATALGRTEGALRSVTGAAAGTIAALGTGLKSAASGLAGVLGGPFGLALIAGVVGLSLFSASQQKAAAATAAHKTNSQNLAAALREANGAITENVRLTAAQNFLGTDQYKDAVDAAHKLGISMGDVTNASLRQGTSMESLKAKLEGIIKANTAIGGYNPYAGGQQRDTMNDTGKAAQTLLDALNGLGGEYDGAIQHNKDLDSALKNGHGSLLQASESGRTLAAAMGVLADKTATADDRARALKDALDSLNGGTINLEAAQIRMRDNLQRLSDYFKLSGDESQDAALKAKGWGDSLVNADGSVNTLTENGRHLATGISDIKDATVEAASKAYDLARSQGKSIPDSIALARAAMQEGRDSLLKTADSADITAGAAERLANKVGLVPGTLTIDVLAPKADQVQAELELLKARVEEVPGTKEIHVESLSDEAQKKLEAVGLTVTRVPGSKDIVITANDGDFNGAIARATAPATKTINIVYYDTGAPIRGQAVGVVNAKGNLLEAFAQGGFHGLNPMRGGYATMVQPNTFRVIGDNLKVPEAYIPLDRSLRSVGILNEAAERMGYAVMRRYATGGIAGTGSFSPTGGDGVILNVNLDARGATQAAVRTLEQSTIPKLRMMLVQQVGRRR